MSKLALLAGALVVALTGSPAYAQNSDSVVGWWSMLIRNGWFRQVYEFRSDGTFSVGEGGVAMQNGDLFASPQKTNYGTYVINGNVISMVFGYEGRYYHRGEKIVGTFTVLRDRPDTYPNALPPLRQLVFRDVGDQVSAPDRFNEMRNPRPWQQ